MFEKPVHQRVLTVLNAMDADLLAGASCWFGGGTAIVLQLGEYRESRDMDFLVSNPAGYRLLRDSLRSGGLGLIVGRDVQVLREARADRDAIRAVLGVNDVPIRFEIVVEGRIDLDQGERIPGIPVPCLSRKDMFAEKLLANADRFADKGVFSRDIIDLIMMERHWGPIPQESWAKAEGVYGRSVRDAYKKAREMMMDRPHREKCFKEMAVSQQARDTVAGALGRVSRRKSPDLGDDLGR